MNANLKLPYMSLCSVIEGGLVTMKAWSVMVCTVTEHYTILPVVILPPPVFTLGHLEYSD